MSTGAFVAMFAFFSIFCLSIAAYNVTLEMQPRPVCHDQDLAEAKSHYAACMARWMTDSTQCTAQAVKMSCKKWGRP